MQIIALEGMEFYAHHGHYNEEQIVGTQFMVDVFVETNCMLACLSDELDDTVNYQTIYTLVQQEMSCSAKLIENVAYRIAMTLLEHLPQIEKVSVKLAKLNPHLGGKVKQSSILVTKSRNRLV